MFKTPLHNTALLFLSLVMALVSSGTRVHAQAGAALHFDGINDYVQFSDPNFGTSNFTIEGWIRPPSSAAGHIATTRTFESGVGGSWFTLAVSSTSLSMELATGGVGYTSFSTNGGLTLNAWNHVALVRSGLRVNLYINGVLKGGATQNGIHNLNTGNNSLRLGGWPDYSAAYFTGAMDEFRIWNVARTQCELLSYMNCEIPNTAVGLIGNYHFNQGIAAGTNTGLSNLTDASVSSRNGTLYSFGLSGATSNWITPGAVASGYTTATTPIAEIEVTGNGSPIADGSTSASVTNHTDFNGAGSRTFVISNAVAGGTLHTAPYLSGGSASQFSLSVTSSTAIAGIGSTSLTVTFIPTSAGTKTTTLTISNSDCDEPAYDFVISATTGPASALSFDGTDDFVETNANIAELGQHDFTIEAWIKTTGVSEAIVTCADGDASWEGGEKCFYLNAAGHPTFVGFGNAYITGNFPANDGQWHHVAVVWDLASGTSGTGKIYVDGINRTGSSGYNAAQNNTGTFKIGKTNYNGFTPEAPNNFKGDMDEVRIWSRALCQPELVNNMNCELNVAIQSDLKAYYRFNNGTLNGINTGLNTATDLSASAITGTLTNFALSGNGSNWTGLGGVTTGVSCSSYLDAEINLLGNATTITDGDITPSATDDTDFGVTCMGMPVIHTFTVQNTGTATLTVSALTKSGSGAASFSVGALSPASPIAAGSSATFAVTFAPTSPGLKTMTLLIANSDCSEASYDMVLTGTANALPVVSATTSQSVICNTFTTSVTASGADTYTWTGTVPATNGLAFSPSVTATYSVTGTNTLTGCTSTNTAVQTITVNALPQLTLSAVSNPLCSGATATLSAAGANSYTWNPGSLTGSTVTTSPATSTSYTALGRNTLTGCSNLAVYTLSVNATPTISLVASQTTVCAGTTLTLTAANADTYTWTPGNATGASISPGLTSTTVYTVTGTSTDGCLSNTLTQTISVNALPLVTASASSPSVCAGYSLSLNGGGADTYTWTGGVSDAVSFTPTASAVYTVTGTDVSSCSNTATIGISVEAVPTVSASITNTTVCTGTSLSLSGAGAVTYSWTGGISNNQPFVATAGNSYTLTGSSAAGCTSTNSAVVSVTVNALPNVGATASNTVLCAGNPVTLSGSGANTYTWTNGVNNNTAFVPALTNTYTVSGEDANGCRNTATLSITVLALPTLTATSSNTLLCAGETVTLTVSGAGSYTWTTGEQTPSLVRTLSSGSSFTVTGKGSNGCTNTLVINQAVSPCTGIEEAGTPPQAFVVYPNPTTGILMIETAVETEVSVLNALGQSVYTEHLEAGTQRIDLSAAPAGMYVVKHNNAYVKIIKH